MFRGLARDRWHASRDLSRAFSPRASWEMPWPLTKEELDEFKSSGLQQVQFEDYFDQE